MPRAQLSQESMVSVASGQSGHGSQGHSHTSSRKRARPDSVIRDPLHVPTPQLLALHSTSISGAVSDRAAVKGRVDTKTSSRQRTGAPAAAVAAQSRTSASTGGPRFRPQ